MNAPYPILEATGPPGSAAIRSVQASLFDGAHVAWQAAADVAQPAELASQLWRQAVHDLRGKLAVVTNVTALLLKLGGDGRRAELMATLDRNVADLRALLNGVADLARLDAQQERPAIRNIDVATTLGDLCNSLQVLAASRGLRLEFRGPPSLIAESDPLMVARIAQNLTLNALQYTHADGVMLTCGRCDEAPTDRWYLAIGDAESSLDGRDSIELPAASGRPTAPSSGEGIGLSIVSRLCGLLGGTMEIARAGAAGRTTRIELPRRYLEPAVSAWESGRGSGLAGRRPADHRSRAVVQLGALPGDALRIARAPRAELAPDVGDGGRQIDDEGGDPHADAQSDIAQRDEQHAENRDRGSAGQRDDLVHGGSFSMRHPAARG